MGHVNIGESTHELVKEEVVSCQAAQTRVRRGQADNQQLTTKKAFTPCGLACPGLRAGVQAKGKGELEMYFVEPKTTRG